MKKQLGWILDYVRQRFGGRRDCYMVVFRHGTNRGARHRRIIKGGERTERFVASLNNFPDATVRILRGSPVSRRVAEKWQVQ